MIGREISKLLVECDANIKVISLDKIKIHEKVEHVYGDLTDFDFCKEQTKDMDCVFHVAGIKGSVKVTLEKPSSFFVPLLMFNTNVLEASRINNVSPFDTFLLFVTLTLEITPCIGDNISPEDRLSISLVDASILLNSKTTLSFMR